MFLLLSLWIYCGLVASKPQLLIHIGPSKTGSTTIQNSIREYINPLKDVGWYPLGANDTVYHGKLEVERTFLQYRNNMPGNFFQNALDNNLNVIISCEGLGSIEEEDVVLYSEVLSKFNTTVVMFYRDFVSVQLSLHLQRRSLNTIVEFLTDADILHSNHVTIGTGGYMERMKIWNRFDRMIVLDFNGMVASKLSFQYEFFCSMMGVLCEHKQLRINKVSNPTTAVRINDIGKARMADLFQNYARQKFCTINIEAFKRSVNVNEIPLKTIDMSHIVKYSILLDKEFRELYESTIYYSNQTAGVMVMNNRREYSDIDISSILMSERWRSRFEDALQAQVANKVAKCDPQSIGDTVAVGRFIRPMNRFLRSILE